MTSIVVEQWIEAPPATVYRYLTEPDKWRRWQGIDADLDAREGGIFSMLMANGMRARGEFVRLVEDELVVFTWGWVDNPVIPPGSTTVEVSLTEKDEGTLLKLIHHLPASEADLHLAGWGHYLPRLALAAAGIDPGTDPGPG